MDDFSSSRSLTPSDAEARSLSDLALLFLKLGTVAFGGPAAHISMMEDEVVRRRQWLTQAQFLDLMGASSIIPGPTSTELAIHIGYRRAGWRGLLISGACFILPAALLVTAIAAAYHKFGQLPQAQSLLYGVKPVVIAVILQALWRLGRTAVKSWLLAGIGLAASVVSFTGANPLAVLFGSGAAATIIEYLRANSERSIKPMAAIAATTPVATTLPASTAAVGLWPLFLLFLKIGSIVFGSGYVLLAFLRSDLVIRLHWLTDRQLIDAVAVGQVTPGPVFTTATFIGYLVSGVRGAAVATIAIFLPAFVLVTTSAPFIAQLRRSSITAKFLDGLNVGSLALMLTVSWQLGTAAILDWITAGIAILASVLLLTLQLNATWLVLGGAVAGIAIRTWA